MNAKVANLEWVSENYRVMAEFERAIDARMISFLKEDGFDAVKVRASGCLGWIWCQWLLGTPASKIASQVGPFIKRGLEMKKLSTVFKGRPIHDLFLLHCAIFTASNEELQEVAQETLDSSGYGKSRPQNNGDLFASALCGMLKNWILGRKEKAEEEFAIVLRAYRDILFAPPQSL
jgi:hypothetical protein